MQSFFLSVGTMLVEGENSRIIPVPHKVLWCEGTG